MDIYASLRGLLGNPTSPLPFKLPSPNQVVVYPPFSALRPGLVIKKRLSLETNPPLPAGRIVLDIRIDVIGAGRVTVPAGTFDARGLRQTTTFISFPPGFPKAQEPKAPALTSIDWYGKGVGLLCLSDTTDLRTACQKDPLTKYRVR